VSGLQAMAAGIVLGCLVGIASMAGPWLMGFVLCAGIVVAVAADRGLRDGREREARRARLKASARQ